jgi:hypothetical protein
MATNSVEDQIREVEERLRQAELGPDPGVFEALLDEHMVLAVDGQMSMPKKFIVEKHTPGSAQKFDRVELRDMEVIDHGMTAVATCTGDFEGPNGRFVFKFMRVWAKKDDGWKIVAGAMFPVELENTSSEENFKKSFSKTP